MGDFVQWMYRSHGSNVNGESEYLSKVWSCRNFYYKTNFQLTASDVGFYRRDKQEMKDQFESKYHMFFETEIFSSTVFQVLIFEKKDRYL